MFFGLFIYFLKPKNYNNDKFNVQEFRSDTRSKQVPFPWIIKTKPNNFFYIF